MIQNLVPSTIVWHQCDIRMTKVEMTNYRSICKCEKEIAIWSGIFFGLFDEKNLIETDLQTCNSWTGRSISYKSVNWYQLNLLLHMAKKNLIWKWISFAISAFSIGEEIYYDCPPRFCKPSSGSKMRNNGSLTSHSSVQETYFGHQFSLKLVC